MKLYQVQHGVAMSAAEDPELPLTQEGARAVERMARWAAAAGLEIDQIRHSDKRRAEPTASILARRLAPAAGTVRAEGLGPKDDIEATAETLRGEEGSVMLVGHLPHLGRLVSLLVAGDPQPPVVRFRNARL